MAPPMEPIEARLAASEVALLLGSSPHPASSAIAAVKRAPFPLPMRSREEPPKAAKCDCKFAPNKLLKALPGESIWFVGRDIPKLEFRAELGEHVPAASLVIAFDWQLLSEVFIQH
jgi:hypothetical protein